MGALTANPSSYAARVWDTTYVIIKNIFDAMLAPIKISLVNDLIIRVLAIVSREEWLIDQIRFAFTAASTTKLPLTEITFNCNIVKKAVVNINGIMEENRGQNEAQPAFLSKINQNHPTMLNPIVNASFESCLNPQIALKANDDFLSEYLTLTKLIHFGDILTFGVNFVKIVGYLPQEETEDFSEEDINIVHIQSLDVSQVLWS